MTDSTTRIFSTGVQTGIVEGRSEEGGLFVEITNLRKKIKGIIGPRTLRPAFYFIG